MQPVEIGSTVKYFRTHPKEESFDAILLAYDILPADADTDAVPSAKLAFIEAKNHHLLRDASWPDAFSVIDQVHHQPIGEFYHGWSESEDAHRLAQAEGACEQASDALFAKDREIRDLQEAVNLRCDEVEQLKAQIAAYDKGPDPAGQPAQPVETATGSDNLVEMPGDSHLGPTA